MTGDAEGASWLRRLVSLNLGRGVKFAAIGLTSFLVFEGILALFVFERSPLLVATPASYELSIFFGFVMNDSLTVKEKGGHSWPVRAIRFNLTYILGIAIVTACVVLLAQRGVGSVLGSIVGVLVAFPVNYVLSMTFVWKQRLL